MNRQRKAGSAAAAILLLSFVTACSSLESAGQLEIPSQITESESPVESTAPNIEPDDSTRQQEGPVEEVEGPTTQDETVDQEPTAAAPEPLQGIDFSQVESRSSRDNCWIVIRGDVYDFTLFVQQHPFGEQISNVVCGKDATETFQENSDIDEVLTRLEPFYLGYLQ